MVCLGLDLLQQASQKLLRWGWQVEGVRHSVSAPPRPGGEPTSSSLLKYAFCAAERAGEVQGCSLRTLERAWIERRSALAGLSWAWAAACTPAPAAVLAGAARTSMARSRSARVLMWQTDVRAGATERTAATEVTAREERASMLRAMLMVWRCGRGGTLGRAGGSGGERKPWGCKLVCSCDCARKLAARARMYVHPGQRPSPRARQECEGVQVGEGRRGLGLLGGLVVHEGHGPL